VRTPDRDGRRGLNGATTGNRWWRVLEASREEREGGEGNNWPCARTYTGNRAFELEKSLSAVFPAFIFYIPTELNSSGQAEKP